ncbi:SLC13 family permease [Telluribacter sp. SYSU D00476]|uniref:SLC13 family permease n=1 Tax=Telluribacter sp. SYSU D00476 TaxID=2811430 RepID=UPI001FF104A0|nr:SLC13 family permease [Telluribacter sp. SYSU D00476]
MVPPSFLHIRIEFILFGLTLLCVALFHHHTLRVALLGLLSIIIFKLVFDPTYHWEEHFLGTRPLAEQLFDKHLRGGEWAILLNLFGLLLGFAILAKHFESSGVPDYLPRYLPDDWKGGFVLLVLIFVMSSFLDNIAAAMIGGTVALVVFKNKVHIGYLAAIVAASNAGGAGSVVGDTTTTMMWIAGVPALEIFPAYIAAITAFLTFAFIASRVQDRYQPIQKDPVAGLTIDYVRLGIVGLILLFTIATNILFDFPALGVWVAILLGSLVRKTPWHELRDALPGTIFLLALVTCASLMPIDELPAASWQSAFVLGFVSSVFDNIPLTKLALDQGGYDWAILAYAVGFGGSMIWFGSSAGVAISNIFPEARSVSRWFTRGWFITVAYVVGFLVILVIKGWHPN